MSPGRGFTRMLGTQSRRPATHLTRCRRGYRDVMMSSSRRSGSVNASMAMIRRAMKMDAIRDLLPSHRGELFARRSQFDGRVRHSSDSLPVRAERTMATTTRIAASSMSATARSLVNEIPLVGLNAQSMCAAAHMIGTARLVERCTAVNQSRTLFRGSPDRARNGATIAPIRAIATNSTRRWRVVESQRPSQCRRGLSHW